MSSFIDFFVSKRSREDLARTPFLTLFVDEKDNSFVVSEEALNDTRVSLTESYGIDKDLAKVVVDLLKVLRWPAGDLNTFEELFSEANRQYMEVMRSVCIASSIHDDSILKTDFVTLEKNVFLKII